MLHQARLLLLAAALAALAAPGGAEMGARDVAAAREATLRMFDDAFEAYMQHGYPADEVRPITCTPLRRGERGALDDVNGDYMLTLVDSLSTLAVMGDPRFNTSVHRLQADGLSFDVDSTVSVFEVTIRMLGGLLSAHLLALESDLVSAYDGWMLDSALDLGKRLLPAFDTQTGIPVGHINLRHGVPPREGRHTCLACAGTLLLEFGVLSRLTDDPRFEVVARRATRAVWASRSALGLLGRSINVDTGIFSDPIASIGASSDSFYEYLLKAHLLFGDDELLDMYQEATMALLLHLRHEPFFRSVDHASGFPLSQPVQIDSLSAFWPGMQALAGDIKLAKETFKAFLDVSDRYGFLPEVVRLPTSGPPVAVSKAYPLRPELLESAYYLWSATGEDKYRQAGKRTIDNLLRRARVDCGFATLVDVTDQSANPKREDKMESFLLSELLKYLFLLFDDGETARKHGIDLERVVFTTEGHPLPMLRRFSRKPEAWPVEPVHAPARGTVASGKSRRQRKTSQQRVRTYWYAEGTVPSLLEPPVCMLGEPPVGESEPKVFRELAPPRLVPRNTRVTINIGEKEFEVLGVGADGLATAFTPDGSLEVYDDDGNSIMIDKSEFASEVRDGRRPAVYMQWGPA